MQLTLSRVTKNYPGKTKKDKLITAVKDVDLNCQDGSLVSILGPSGCGKSTLLKMIAGLEAPTSGRIIFGDTDVTDLSPEKRGIGLVFQNYALYPHLTVLQNICFPLENLKGSAKLSSEEILARAKEAARMVQIEKYFNRKPAELSGGQQQRVAIARALVKRPNILLLDEPLSNLDAALRLQTRAEIRKIQKETNITTLFVTHDQDEAMSISDYIVVMRDGVIMQVGKPQEVYDNPNNMFVAKFLGVPPICMFNGKIESGKLYIGNAPVLTVDGAEDAEVYVGVRPEAFLVEEDGALKCNLNSVEVLGRDTCVIADNAAAVDGSFRCIVIAEYAPSADAKTVNFNLKPEKVFLFNKVNEQRIYCSLGR